MFQGTSCSPSGHCWRLAQKKRTRLSVADNFEGVEGWGWGGRARSLLSAKVFLCGVSHIFPLLVVAVVMWLVALPTLVAGALLPMVAALLVGP